MTAPAIGFAPPHTFKLTRLIMQILFTPVLLVALVLLGLGSGLLLVAERFGKLRRTQDAGPHPERLARQHAL